MKKKYFYYLLFLLLFNPFRIFSQEEPNILNEFIKGEDKISIIQKYSSIEMLEMYTSKFKNDSVSVIFTYNNVETKRKKPDSIDIDKEGKKAVYYYKFDPDEIKKMKDLKIVFQIGSKKYDFISNFTEPVKFNFDLKPSFIKENPQRLDYSISRKFGISNKKSILSQFNILAEGYLSSKPDTNSLNSLKFNLEYQFLLSKASEFKFIGLSIIAGSEHPQDFSQTNLKGSIVISTIIPFSDYFTRFITGNKRDACIGILTEPEIQFIKNTSYSDSNFVRLALHGNWNIPLLDGQYFRLYGVAFYQNGFKPRSYIEGTLEQKVTSSIYLIGKWVNGTLPPLFTKESEFSVGLRIK
jgi:hypothetical protein